MFDWIKSLFGTPQPARKKFGRVEPTTPWERGFRPLEEPKFDGEILRADAEDPADRMRFEVAMRAFQTGNMVIGNIDDDGNATIEEIDIRHDP